MSEPSLDPVVADLRASLGDNLFSCCIYGSAVRGNILEGASDLNLLLVLNDSGTEAHEAIAGLLGGYPTIEPFVLGREGFLRSVQAFAPKFASIMRNYRVLHGEDPFIGIEIPASLEKFLCEQALRNFRLRLAYAFIKRSRKRSYLRFLAGSVTPLFLRLSEVVRLHGASHPSEFAGRIPAFEDLFEIDGATMRDLLALKQIGGDEKDAEAWHQRVFPLVDKVVGWIEHHWPASPLR